ncbi:MAG TPA: polyprenyl synthetase family protein [Oscillospiraceae bacterium]|nr:polyprenyl synthetase family protein [Oscillospiraceae bacterium]HPF55637.1 polyprenyl synthetase family protein [Clostridiales bacterium]HPK34204.1 polyprenyl synthetase family protein [Oscillospiraceae bacterium]HPR74893.1 polyprenyl synthetase family protein [Oscillospiraceae bacterium]
MIETEFLKEFKIKTENAEQAVLRYLPKAESYNKTTVEAMIYSVKNGGKRLRPLLMIEFFNLTGNDETPIYPFAAALEYIHSYSLVHDDLPCMDNSDLRRGKPSTHKQFGQWQALLAGDGLLNYAFEIVLNHADFSKLPAETVCACLKELAQASGITGMVGGQNLDLESEGKRLTAEELTLLQSKKTGAIIKAAGRIGVIASGGDENTLRLADEYCENLGRMFQITDDILDVSGDEKLLGKPTNGDSVHDKSTFVSELGLTKAKTVAGELTENAVKAAQALNCDFLAELAKYLLIRKN